MRSSAFASYLKESDPKLIDEQIKKSNILAKVTEVKPNELILSISKKTYALHAPAMAESHSAANKNNNNSRNVLLRIPIDTLSTLKQKKVITYVARVENNSSN